MSEQGYITANFQCTFDYTVRACGDLFRGFTPGWRPVTNCPAGSLFLYVRRGAAFVRSVIPFAKIVGGLRRKSSQPSGIQCTAHRARKNQFEATSLENLGEDF